MQESLLNISGLKMGLVLLLKQLSITSKEFGLRRIPQIAAQSFM